jgi:hypothetical protein
LPNLIKARALRGYVLEEVLAKLMQTSGYRLLVDKNQDPAALAHGRHGLLVRGRGTDHQADVLGELALPTPFSFPIRLFVEAKYRKTDRVELADVRNARGVLDDVNERHSGGSTGPDSMPLRRYQYQYVLFSTRGFTTPAQQYAMAQQISLIDLSSVAFTGLLESVTQAASDLLQLAEDTVSTFPLGQMRTALRLALETWTADGLDAPTTETRALGAAQSNPARHRERQLLPDGPLADIANNLATQPKSNLILGFPAAPFILALLPDNPAAFREYITKHAPDVRVNISRREGDGHPWAIIPADGSQSFRTRFTLPTTLRDWLLSDKGAAPIRARDVKSGLLWSIAIFHDGQLIRLLFELR